MLIFLGGTAANNQWRGHFVERLLSKGVAPEEMFNPVVADWDDEAQRKEEEAKVAATHMLFYLADPRQDGNPLSVYSMVEATMALYDRLPSTVVVFDTAGMTGHPLKAMNQTFKVLKARHPIGNIFDSPQAAVDWLAAEKQKGDHGSGRPSTNVNPNDR